MFHAGIVLIGIFCLKAVLMFIPLPALYVAVGAIFPIYIAIPLVFIGLLGEFSIGFFIGRNLNTQRLMKLLKRSKKLEKYLEKKEENIASVCLGMRLTPLPVDLVSYYLGSTTIGYSTYIFFSLLGIGPKAVPLVVIGAAVTNPLSPEFLKPLIITVIVCLLVLKGYRKKQEKMNMR
jgi:uncharacterized membrane protein YdjX (TVP38/TMEM64 family)